MTSGPKIESQEYSDLHRVIRWFISLRWIAFSGVLVSVALAHVILVETHSFTALYLLTTVLGAANAAFWLYYDRYKRRTLSRREMRLFLHTQVCNDFLLLFLLVYFTGFLQNPFTFFFAFHIALASFIFSPRTVYIYTAVLVAAFCLTTAGQVAGVVPYISVGAGWESGIGSVSHFIHLAGLVSTLAIAAYLLTSIKSRIEERGKSVEVELNRYKSLDKVKSNFILQVTHELRGPLAALKGYHEMVLKGIAGRIEERTADVLQKADVRTRNLLTIIDEMIDYAYMRSGDDVKFDPHTVVVRSAITKNCDQLIPLAHRKSITLTCSCPDSLELRISPDLFDILLSNLMTNAVKYSPEKTDVTISAVQDEGMIHISVKDQGMGIAPDEMETIFEEFYRTRRARELERDGTGLGLSIVKRVVEVLGGKIAVYSEVDKGTTFHVYLPGKQPIAGGKNGRNESADH